MDTYQQVIINEYVRINELYKDAVKANDWMTQSGYAFILNAISTKLTNVGAWEVYNALPCDD